MKYCLEIILYKLNDDWRVRVLKVEVLEIFVVASHVCCY